MKLKNIWNIHLSIESFIWFLHKYIFAQPVSVIKVMNFDVSMMRAYEISLGKLRCCFLCVFELCVRELTRCKRAEYWECLLAIQFKSAVSPGALLMLHEWKHTRHTSHGAGAFLNNRSLQRLSLSQKQRASSCSKIDGYRWGRSNLLEESEWFNIFKKAWINFLGTKYSISWNMYIWNKYRTLHTSNT